MKKVYAKDGDFYKEIELVLDHKDKMYSLTKRHISGKNAQGHTMQFSEKEIELLREIISYI